MNDNKQSTLSNHEYRILRKRGNKEEEIDSNLKCYQDNILQSQPSSNIERKNIAYCAVIALVIVFSLNVWGFYLNPRSYQNGMSAPIPYPTCPKTLYVSDTRSIRSGNQKFGRDSAFAFMNPLHYIFCAVLTIGLLAISYAVYINWCQKQKRETSSDTLQQSLIQSD